MRNNAIMLGWNRALLGREQLAAQMFQAFTQYLQGLQKEGTIDSFEPIFVTPHGGSLNGFFVLRGNPQKLDELCGSRGWAEWLMKGTLHLEGLCELRALSGPAVAERMALYTESIPR